MTYIEESRITQNYTSLISGIVFNNGLFLVSDSDYQNKTDLLIINPYDNFRLIKKIPFEKMLKFIELKYLNFILLFNNNNFILLNKEDYSVNSTIENKNLNLDTFLSVTIKELPKGKLLIYQDVNIFVFDMKNNFSFIKKVSFDMNIIDLLLLDQNFLFICFDKGSIFILESEDFNVIYKNFPNVSRYTKAILLNSGLVAIISDFMNIDIYMFIQKNQDFRNKNFDKNLKNNFGLNNTENHKLEFFKENLFLQSYTSL